jgi:uncharacterized protein YjiS (DUF1127 family)
MIILRRTIHPYIPSAIRSIRRERTRTMLSSITRFLHAWKRYGVAVDELSHLSDRELADIGITRSDIPRIAWEQARV